MHTDLLRLLRLLRKRIGKLQADSLAEACAVRLREVEDAGPEVLRGWRPWHLLDLLQLGLMHGRHTLPARLTDEETLCKLMNILQETDGHHPAPQLGGPFGAYRFLRQVAFEQFWLQGRLSWIDLGRLELQFSGLPSNNPVTRCFQGSTGLPLPTYASMLFILWSWAAKDPKRVCFRSVNLFGKLDFSPSDAASFLDLLSLPLDSAQDWLKTRKKYTNPLHELYEPVSFVRKPLISVGGVHFLPSRRVLEQHIRVGVQEVCRDVNANLTGAEFGKRQEHYLALLLQPWIRDLLTERSLKRWTTGKVADFVVMGATDLVVVESKAIDPPFRFRVDPSEDVARMYLDDLVDAFAQCVATVQLLRQRGETRAAFAWVVTRSDFYYLSGLPLWKELLQDRIAHGVIAPDRFFLTSLADFETIIAAHPSPEAFVDFLSRTAISQADPQTAALRLTSSLEVGVGLPAVKGAYDALSSRVEGHFRDRSDA